MLKPPAVMYPEMEREYANVAHARASGLYQVPYPAGRPGEGHVARREVNPASRLEGLDLAYPPQGMGGAQQQRGRGTAGAVDAHIEGLDLAYARPEGGRQRGRGVGGAGLGVEREAAPMHAAVRRSSDFGAGYPRSEATDGRSMTRVARDICNAYQLVPGDGDSLARFQERAEKLVRFYRSVSAPEGVHEWAVAFAERTSLLQMVFSLLEVWKGEAAGSTVGPLIQRAANQLEKRGADWLTTHEVVLGVADLLNDLEAAVADKVQQQQAQQAMAQAVAVGLGGRSPGRLPYPRLPAPAPVSRPPAMAKDPRDGRQCKYYAQSGVCPYGRQCKFPHHDGVTTRHTIPLSPGKPM